MIGTSVKKFRKSDPTMPTNACIGMEFKHEWRRWRIIDEVGVWWWKSWLCEELDAAGCFSHRPSSPPPQRQTAEQAAMDDDTTPTPPEQAATSTAGAAAVTAGFPWLGMGVSGSVESECERTPPIVEPSPSVQTPILENPDSSFDTSPAPDTTTDASGVC